MQVGVHSDEFNALNPGFPHAVDGVVACAADANYLYVNNLVLFIGNLKRHSNDTPFPVLIISYIFLRHNSIGR